MCGDLNQLVGNEWVIQESAVRGVCSILRSNFYRGLFRLVSVNYKSPCRGGVRFVKRVLRDLRGNRHVFALLGNTRQRSVTFKRPVAPRRLLTLVLASATNVREAAPLMGGKGFVHEGSVVVCSIALNALARNGSIIYVLTYVTTFMIVGRTISRQGAV